MLGIALTLALLDGPDWESCARVPWGENLQTPDLRTRDHVMPGYDARPMHLRVCEVYMGFGYSDVLVMVWDAAKGSAATALQVRHTHSACRGTTVGAHERGAWVRTSICGYHDDGPVAEAHTRFRWTETAPFVVVES